MTENKPTIYEILKSFPIGEQLATVSTGSEILYGSFWGGFYEGNARFISVGGPVYIPLSKILYIKR